MENLYKIIQEFDNQPSDFRQKMEALVPSVRRERLISIKAELKNEKEKQEKSSCSLPITIAF